MLDTNLIRNNSQEIKRGISAKNIDATLVDKFLEFDEKWRSSVKQHDNLRAQQKKLGKENLVEAKRIKEKLKKIDADTSDLDKMRQEILHQIPNLPLPSVPLGKGESENKIIKEEGEKPKLENPKDYLILSKNLDLIDIERAAKTSGSRFGYLKGAAALLEFALIDLAIRTAAKDGFVPIVPPTLINEKSMWSMGYLERGREEIYHLPQDNLYLVGTSEQSIGPMHAGELFNEEELPKRYIAFSTCFRREAGSYGKDTKGILRVHQFDKIEMFSFTKPENSEKEHQLLLSIEEKLMKALKIPYRVLNICSGDLGDSAAAKFDIEAWLPGQRDGKGEYRETHSTSNTTDYQARRLNIKYKDKSGKPKFVHMLNGTAFAIGRSIIAIIENYQTEKGTILVPQVLQSYLNIKEIK